MILGPENWEKSVILENFEEILKTCFDNTKFCDFPTPVLSPVPVLKRTKSIIVAKIWAETDKSRKILRLKKSSKSERKDWRRETKILKQ